jgi:cell division protease FtsH
MIDTKVRDILKQAYNQAREIITKNKELHEKISQALLEKEEMLKEDFDAFFEAIEGVPSKIQQ